LVLSSFIAWFLSWAMPLSSVAGSRKLASDAV
jgi:hypothetical protein